MSTDFTLVNKWSVDDTQDNVSSRFTISYAVTIGGTLISSDKNSATTTSGLTWTPDSNLDYELGWKILADKTDTNGL